MKQFSAIETLKLMLERPNIMFNVIKKMDRQNERFISEAAVALTVLDEIKNLDKKKNSSVLKLLMPPKT